MKYQQIKEKYSFKILKELDHGEIIFTMPTGLLKCGGAPQKIMWLSDDFCRRMKTRDKFNFHFIKEGDGIFGVEKYKKVLQSLVESRNINTHYFEQLIAVDGKNKKAIFKNLKTSTETERPYDLLHVVPHFKTHDFISKSDLANEKGEVAVDKYNLQSTKYKNVFSG
jgi:NADPH-dependent 2,4-dienoyl-CoA reductase/sulfur reductase-like enzyme